MKLIVKQRWAAKFKSNFPEEKTVKSRLLTSIAALCLFFSIMPVAGISTLPDGRVSVMAASTSDWPQWRGPERDGISRERGLLKQWPTEGPKLIWQVNDIGDGFSGPSVVGTRLYLMRTVAWRMSSCRLSRLRMEKSSGQRASATSATRIRT